MAMLGIQHLGRSLCAQQRLAVLLELGQQLQETAFGGLPFFLMASVVGIGGDLEQLLHRRRQCCGRSGAS
ncbi:hypothetical protein [Xanthomonas bonasiae]|uniref:hypothetical protein n=1 Tax=Xanthomonas bonasiae TaxID=2810351 RepID=UPI001CD88EA8|nr:hypothetical protein [Xanthomonas surreyensis]